MAKLSFLLDNPYGDAPDAILRGWFPATSLFATTPPSHWGDQDFIGKVNRAFEQLSREPTQFNPHITSGLSGLYASIRNAAENMNSRPTRAYLLLRSHFESELVSGTVSVEASGEGKDRHNRPRQYLRSPFQFLMQLLTDPKELATGAYAKAVVRAQIFTSAVRYAQSRHNLLAETRVTAYKFIAEAISFDNMSISLSKAKSYHSRGDTFPIASTSDYILGHMLGMNGYAALSFAPNREIYRSQRKHELPIMGRDTFLDSNALEPTGEGAYEFRFLRAVEELPSIAEILNQLDGMPVPLPGASTLFAGGLRFSSNRGSVMRIAGKSGSGKTSFALALCAALSPLGISAVYLTSEEDPEDLEKRLTSLIPSYVHRTYSFRAISEWFEARHLDSSSAPDNLVEAQSFVSKALKLYESAGFEPSVHRPPGLIPFIFVIDGMHELFVRDEDVGKKLRTMHVFIERLRELGALVLLLTADIDEPVLQEADYIVDTVLELSIRFESGAGAEALRTLTLHKSRLQHAVPGMHPLHISSSDGLKIYPQLSAQFGSYSKLKSHGPNPQQWFTILQAPSESPNLPDFIPALARVFTRSQILVSGFGSSGKASFGMHLLCSPIITKGRTKQTNLFSLVSKTPPYRQRNRVLIVSFLYPAEYYQAMLKKTPRRRGDNADPTYIDVVSFYPGFLRPEVLTSKIIAALQAAELEGIPYKGVLIDGLHNLFLQFPLLDHQLLTWPMLYRALRSIDVTVVTTHTHFSVPQMDKHPLLGVDVEAAARRVAPLLQSIVNAADFYFDISAPAIAGTEDSFKIDVIAAYGQPVKDLPYCWNREHSRVEFIPSSVAAR